MNTSNNNCIRVVMYPPDMREELGGSVKIFTSDELIPVVKTVAAGGKSPYLILESLLAHCDKNLSCTTDGPNGVQLETHIFYFNDKTRKILIQVSQSLLELQLSQGGENLPTPNTTDKQ